MDSPIQPCSSSLAPQNASSRRTMIILHTQCRTERTHVLGAESEHGKAPRVCVNRTTAFASWHGVNGRRGRGRRSVVEARARAVLIIALADCPLRPSIGRRSAAVEEGNRQSKEPKEEGAQHGHGHGHRPSIMHACMHAFCCVPACRPFLVERIDRRPRQNPTFFTRGDWRGVMERLCLGDCQTDSTSMDH